MAGRPDIEQLPDGGYLATRDIDSWRGALGLLLDAAEAPGTPASFTAEVTLASGEHQAFSSAESLRSSGLESRPDDLSAVRLVATYNGSPLEAIIGARPEFPGAYTEVRGDDKARSIGAAVLIHERMMDGHRDRLTTFRFLGAAGLAFLPLFVFSATHLPKWTLIFAVVAVLPLLSAGFAIFSVKTPVEFVMPPDPVPSWHERARAWIAAALQNRWVKWTLRGVGLVLLGIATNKVSDLIHWP